MDAVLAGFIGASGDHTAPAGRGAIHDGQPPPLGVVSLLDGGVESVEVDVHDEAGHGADGGSVGLSGQARSNYRWLPDSDPITAHQARVV
jgi:hypothetical protein